MSSSFFPQLIKMVPYLAPLRPYLDAATALVSLGWRCVTAVASWYVTCAWKLVSATVGPVLTIPYVRAGYKAVMNGFKVGSDCAA